MLITNKLSLAALLQVHAAQMLAVLNVHVEMSVQEQIVHAVALVASKFKSKAPSNLGLFFNL
jgi:hypothetical protein